MFMQIYQCRLRAWRTSIGSSYVHNLRQKFMTASRIFLDESASWLELVAYSASSVRLSQTTRLECAWHNYRSINIHLLYCTRIHNLLAYQALSTFVPRDAYTAYRVNYLTRMYFFERIESSHPRFHSTFVSSAYQLETLLWLQRKSLQVS